MYGPEWDSFFIPVYAYFNTGASTMFQVLPTWQGYTPQCDYTRPQGSHPGGTLVTLFDGSGRFVSGSIQAAVWWAATTPNQGEVLGDW
jgi:hypothetical protein